MAGPGGLWKRVSIAALVLGTALAAWGASAEPALTTLYSFGSISGDGAPPRGPLAFDELGALYGTTIVGGAYHWGTVFKVTPPAEESGPWSEQILYSFRGDRDGAFPSSGVIFDRAGNLYGTAQQGGAYGYGTVFRGVAPADPDGPWGGQLLWSFTGMEDGSYPGGLLLDGSTGVLYGTTDRGGLPSPDCAQRYCGTVFSLTPPATADAAWTYTVIWRFTGGEDGGNPGWDDAHLAIDESGALYGTTWTGGAYGHGTVFRLTPGEGGYSLTTIWSFSGSDGDRPRGSLTFKCGELAGTTWRGGAFNAGTVFEASPPPTPDDAWEFAPLYSFTGQADGAEPNGGLVFDRAGNLYGTAKSDRTTRNCSHGTSGCGTAFMGMPPVTSDGAWGGALLWRFTGGADGGNPGPLIFDADGTALYGTTEVGGEHGVGTVFKLTP